MKIFKSIKIEVLLLLAVIVIGSFSCKKSAVAPVKKPVVLVNDSITQNGFTLIFINKDTAYQEKGGNSRKALEKIFFTVYPQIRAYFNQSAPRRVTFVMDPAYDQIAQTDIDNSIVTFNPVWVLANQADVNVVTHEVTHVTQYHYLGYVPGWMLEGLAEYSRNKFGVDNAAVGWYIADYTVGETYTQGYSVVARFIMWAEAKYRPGIAQAIAKDMQAGTYSDTTTWQELTGSTLDQLWNSYSENPYF